MKVMLAGFMHAAAVASVMPTSGEAPVDWQVRCASVGILQAVNPGAWLMPASSAGFDSMVKE